MAFNETNLISDLPQLIAFYQKLRVDIDNPAAIAVVPAVNAADAADKALAIAQHNLGEFIGLVRTFIAQGKATVVAPKV